MSLGADEFVDYRKQPFEVAAQGVDAVFDTVGDDTFERSFGVVKSGGQLISIVTRLTPEHEAKAKQQGIHAEFTAVTPSGTDMAVLAQMVEAGQLKPHVSQTFPLEAVA